MSPRSETVSFRLPAVFHKQLVDEARRRGIKSHHDLARQFVVDAIADTEREVRQREAEELRRAIETLREDLATAAAVLLTNAGKWPADQAKAWARDTLLQRPS